MPVCPEGSSTFGYEVVRESLSHFRFNTRFIFHFVCRFMRRIHTEMCLCNGLNVLFTTAHEREIKTASLYL